MKLLGRIAVLVVVFTAGAALQAHYDVDANRYYRDVIGRRYR